MPGLRIRADGWTVGRTRMFLAVLAQTGCVTDAARVAGVSTTSVNRSRRLFAPFDRACEEALAKALRGLEAVAYQRAVEGREMVILRDGKEVERRIVPSDSLLAMLIRRGDLSGILGRALTPEEAEAFVLPDAVRHRFIDRAEFESGIVFQDGVKQKHHIATQAETDAVLNKRIEMVWRMRRLRAPDHPHCDACGQMIPLTQAELDAAWEEEEARLDALAGARTGEGVLDLREHTDEAEPEHLEGDDAGERDQRGDQSIFDRGGGPPVAE